MCSGTATLLSLVSKHLCGTSTTTRQGKGRKAWDVQGFWISIVWIVTTIRQSPLCATLLARILLCPPAALSKARHFGQTVADTLGIWALDGFGIREASPALRERGRLRREHAQLAWVSDSSWNILKTAQASAQPNIASSHYAGIEKQCATSLLENSPA